MGEDQVTGHEPTEEHEDPAALTPEQEAQRDSEAATQGDQGPQVREQNAAATGPGTVTSSDPNTPVAQSPPPPNAQSGVPALADGSNEGVEPQPEYAGDQATGPVGGESDSADRAGDGEPQE